MLTSAEGRGKQMQQSLLSTASVENPTEALKNANYKQKLALFVHRESQHASSVKFSKEIHREATSTQDNCCVSIKGEFNSSLAPITHHLILCRNADWTIHVLHNAR